MNAGLPGCFFRGIQIQRAGNVAEEIGFSFHAGFKKQGCLFTYNPEYFVQCLLDTVLKAFEPFTGNILVAGPLQVPELFEKLFAAKIAFLVLQKVINTDIHAALVTMAGIGIDTFGINCSIGPDLMTKTVETLSRHSQVRV